MARQVAHEIKSATPIRQGPTPATGAADKRVDFDRVLDHNVNQILAEIDQLDEIARAFKPLRAAPTSAPDRASGHRRDRARGRRSSEWVGKGGG
jgi:hypothetical protein